jgi:hypothetical protein
MRAWWIPLVPLTALVGCGGAEAERTPPRTAPFESQVAAVDVPIGQELTLQSPAFGNGDIMPREFTADGRNAAPPVAWDRAPQGTRSFALVCIDPDAPRGEFTHWVVWDIPAGARKLDVGSAQPPMGVAGRNDFGRLGWGGPAPPLGHGPHRYVFRLYALDVPALGLAEGSTRADVERGMAGHILALAETVGVYER